MKNHRDPSASTRRRRRTNSIASDAKLINAALRLWELKHRKKS